MKTNIKNRIISLFLLGAMTVGTLAGCGSTDDGNTGGSTNTGGTTSIGGSGGSGNSDDLVVVKYGSHTVEDPNAIDSVTGAYVMEDEDMREMWNTALQTVRDELGVDYQYVVYPNAVTTDVLQSVIAGDPIANIIRIQQTSEGTLLGQNVLKPVTQWIDLLGDEVPDPIYGENYFINVGGNYTHSLSSLYYNITLLEAVPGLKDENGRTIYPSDLYLSGEWTWSKFEEYLTIIDAYYANSSGPVRPENRINAMCTYFPETFLLAIHANGGAIYGADGLGVNSPETIEAVEYIGDLMDAGLLTYPEHSDEYYYAVEWTEVHSVISSGETVFFQFHDWRGQGIANDLATRGESLGWIPFPRPDDMEFDDPDYQQVRRLGESFAITKGTSDELTELAIKAYVLLNQTYADLYRERYNDEVVSASLTFDAFHPEVGQDMLDIYFDMKENIRVNEMGITVGVFYTVSTLISKSLTSYGGISNDYATAIASEIGTYESMIATMEALLSTDDVKDNIAPTMAQIEAETYEFPVGTDLSTIDFTSNVAVTDNLDTISSDKIVVDLSEVDSSVPGLYAYLVKMSVEDESGNAATLNLSVTIYDPENTTPPVVTVKEDYRAVAVDEDVSAISWTDFIESAVDTDGISVIGTLKADVSEFDTSAAGDYDVAMTVTDYAGNETVTTVTITVE